ncbi:MAG: hypothetical protein ACRDSR_15430 [Pseudonocardiaceae bacterium]
MSGYLVETVVDRGESSEHVVIGTAHRLVDGVGAQGVFVPGPAGSGGPYSARGWVVSRRCLRVVLVTSARQHRFGPVVVAAAQSVLCYFGIDYSVGD